MLHEVSADPPRRAVLETLLAQDHYLGYRSPVGDWRAKYGHDIDLVETYVDQSRFRGGCYAASNWVELGLTQGRSRGDREHRKQVPPKAVWVYGLQRPVQERLCR